MKILMLKKSMICNIQESIILVMRKSMIKTMNKLSRLSMIKYVYKWTRGSNTDKKISMMKNINVLEYQWSRISMMKNIHDKEF